MKIEPETVNFPVKLSIVVVSNASRQELRDCLDSILAGENQNKIEIITAGCGTAEYFSDLTRDYSSVQFLRFKDKVGIPALSAAAIERAKGEIIALTDSSCLVDGNWITSVIEAHQSHSPVIGGAVEIYDPEKPLDWAAYFCDYAQFMFPLKAGAAAALPGNNISFKRCALKVGNEYVRNHFTKTLWCQKLQAAGIELTLDPKILVYYTRKFKIASLLARRFHHGRVFAGTRVQAMMLPKRVLYIFGSIFLPMIFLLRIIFVVFNKKRFIKEFLISFPFIVLAVLFWSIGEICGYLAGKGKSCNYT